MMTDMTSCAPSPCLPTAELRDFFDRLAAGDYHELARELNISYRPLPRTRAFLESTSPDVSVDVDAEDHQDPDASIQSIDSVESFKFKPTAEGLHRAVSLLRGDETRRVPPTPEEEEAFQFTFRLMIHKLYSIKDFAQMVDDVVRTSRERFQPLSPELTGRRRSSLSFSFNNSDGDGDSFTSMHSPTSPTDSSSFLPSSPSSWTLDPFHNATFESADDGDVRAVKKRIVGRKLSVVDGSLEGESRTPAWVYDAAVASVESPSSSAYFDVPLSPVGGSPSRAGLSGHAAEGDYTSRKRRFSLLAARGL